jgi:hypothetical protein
MPDILGNASSLLLLLHMALYSAHGYLDDLRRLECYGTFVWENVAVV